jgi:hypothetical protein
MTGAGNAWSTLSVDPEEDLVFIPTGSAAPDYYGGIRPGDDKWADSVVALRASSGKFVWGFQVVHHDLQWFAWVASRHLVSGGLASQSALFRSVYEGRQHVPLSHASRLRDGRHCSKTRLTNPVV